MYKSVVCNNQSQFWTLTVWYIGRHIAALSRNAAAYLGVLLLEEAGDAAEQAIPSERLNRRTILWS